VVFRKGRIVLRISKGKLSDYDGGFIVRKWFYLRDTEVLYT
jgi:hypothetical protein